ncbi:MAG: hypothetical protein U0353_11305 [Sandaracinus sp.]
MVRSTRPTARPAATRRSARLSLPGVDVWLRAQGLGTTEATRLARVVRTRVGPRSPVAMAIDVAAALLAPRERRSVCAALACFHVALDLLDDLQDLRTEPDGRPDSVLDAHRLLVCVLRSTHGPVLGRAALVAARGQAGEAASTARTSSLSESRRHRGLKAGTLGAAYLRVVGRAAGKRRPALEALGRRFADTAQLASDLCTLLADDQSEDWRLLRPTEPLVAAFRSRATRAHALALAAGHRDARSLAALRWLLRDVGTAERLALDATALDRAVRGSRLHAPARAALSAHTQHLALTTARARDALRSAMPIRRWQPSLAQRVADASANALAFMREMGAGDLDEVHRWGLFGADVVRADVFGRLVVIEALAPLAIARRLPLRRWFRGVLRRADVDGLRYYPGRLEIPRDTDDAGLLLQGAAALGVSEHAALARARRDIRRSARRDGWVHTWVESRIWPRSRILAGWMGDECPAVSANAWLGLSRLARERASRLVSSDRLRSPHYTDVAALCLVSRLARRLAGSARHALTARLEEAARDADRLTSIEAALVLRELPPGSELAVPLAHALFDSQHADGGFAPDPYYRTIAPAAGIRWYGSRVLTTALVLRAWSAHAWAADDGMAHSIAAVATRTEGA